MFVDFAATKFDLDMLKFMLNYFETHYPFSVFKVHVLNCDLKEIANSKNMKKELKLADPFGITTFWDKTYKREIVKMATLNCIPVEYGGYGRIEFKYVEEMNIWDLMEYLMGNILINNT